MIDLYVFLCGSAWVIIGMGLFGWVDPYGDYDDLVIDGDYGVFQFAVALILWPLTLLLIWLRKGR